MLPLSPIAPSKSEVYKWRVNTIETFCSCIGAMLRLRNALIALGLCEVSLLSP